MGTTLEWNGGTNSASLETMPFTTCSSLVPRPSLHVQEGLGTRLKPLASLWELEHDESAHLAGFTAKL